MKRNVFLASACAAFVALGLMAHGCSSTSNSGAGGSTGSGGSSGSGAGGHIGGQGGTLGGQGGASADAGADAGPLTCASPAPDDGAQCNNNPACNKNCGVNIMALSTVRAQKTCTCNGTWTCGACTYPTDVDLSCLRLPATPVACPHDPADGGTTALIRPGVTPCSPPNSEVCGSVCGSATAGTFSYQDSTGAGKVGYCACISGAYQCASVAEWPTP